MASTTSATARRAGARGADATDAFLDDSRSPSNLASDTKRAGAGMAAKVGSAAEPDSGHFFGRDSAPAKAGRPPQPPPPPSGDDLDTVIEDFDDYGGYDATTAFEDIDDLDREPTPALLAAKAEPLGGAPASARQPRRSPKSNRSKAGEAARVSKNRAKGRRKTKDPSKFWIGVGFLAVLLAGFATAYFLTQGGDDATDSDLEAGATSSTEVTTETTLADGQSAPAETTPVDSAPESPSGAQPVVIFDDAAIGPIDAGVSYTIGVGEGPESAMYQLLVDNEPAADPAPVLPPVIFTPGRHLLVVDITSPSGNIKTNPVLVYAVGDLPPPNWRANLSSVNIQDEGWAEAARQFDEYVAAGHADLQLMPSDRFPSLSPGYWNLFVGGFADNEAALAYCEQYGLAVPDDCFPKLADPTAPAGG